MGDAAKRESGFGFNPLGFRHPIVRLFAGESDPVVAGLTGVEDLAVPQAQDPRAVRRAAVALAFDNGDPAVIEAPRYRGTVIQVATSADAGWTTWPLHPSYLPVMEQIVLQAAAGRQVERERPGRPAARPGPPRRPAPRHRSRSLLPDGRSLPVEAPGPAAASASSTSRRPSSPAPTRSRSGRRWRSTSLFAANGDPAESDPAKLDRAGLSDAVPGWSFAYFTNWRELTGNAASVSRRGELHRPLLYAVLACSSSNRSSPGSSATTRLKVKRGTIRR